MSMEKRQNAIKVFIFRGEKTVNRLIEPFGSFKLNVEMAKRKIQLTVATESIRRRFLISGLVNLLRDHLSLSREIKNTNNKKEIVS
jgi:hypothetical protein